MFSQSKGMNILANLAFSRWRLKSFCLINKTSFLIPTNHPAHISATHVLNVTTVCPNSSPKLSLAGAPALSQSQPGFQLPEPGFECT